jgi:hypothetical protein
MPLADFILAEDLSRMFSAELLFWENAAQNENVNNTRKSFFIIQISTWKRFNSLAGKI